MLCYEFLYGISKARNFAEHSKKCFQREDSRKENIVKSLQIMYSNYINDGNSQEVNCYVLANNPNRPVSPDIMQEVNMISD